jgi:hypothetical protein
MLRCVFLFVVYFASIFSSELNAQASERIDSLEKRYQQQAIWLHDSYFIKNNTRYPFPLLEKQLFASPEAYLLYKKSIGTYRTGKGLAFLGTAFNIGALALRNKDSKLSNSFLYSGIGLNLVGLFMGSRGRLGIEKAVFRYNRDLMFAPYFRH